MANETGQPRPRRGLSLKVTAPLLLCLPVLAVAVIITLIGSIQGRFAVTQLTRENLDQIHRRIGDHLDRLLSLPPQVVRLNAGLMSDGRLGPDDLKNWVRPLFVQAQAFPDLSSVTWETADGKVVWVARYPRETNWIFGIKDQKTAGDVAEFAYDEQGGLPKSALRSFPYDPREWTPYQAAAAGRTGWADPVDWIDDSGNVTAVALAYVMPWTDANGTFRGALTAQFTLDDISQFLRTLPVSHLTRSYIVDRTGQLIATSIDSENPERRINAEESRVALVAESAKRLTEQAGPWRQMRRLRDAQLTVGGQTYLAQVTPMTHHSGLNWLIVTLTPQRQLMSQINSASRASLLASILAASLMLALGVFLALRLVRPILAVSEHVGRIGSGDFDTRLRLTASPEFTDMSDAINRMSHDLKDRLRLRRDLSLAMEVQQTLLPSHPPEINGLQLAARSIYCEQTGGDYYDFFPAGQDESLIVVVGDVSGHGVPSAMLMATARGILRSHAQSCSDLPRILEHLNAMLAEFGVQGRFMTMLLMRFDVPSRRLCWTSAGHGWPLLFHPSSRQFQRLGEPGLPLGVEQDERYDEYAIDQLAPGSVILAATDGVWETMNAAGEQFGNHRLEQLLHEQADASAEEIASALEASLASFRGAVEQRDDLTFVVIKVT